MRAPRPIIVGLALAGLAATVGAAVIALRPPPDLPIGLVGSLTGRFASLGTDGRDGAILAVEEINAAGGVLGRRLALDILDDHGDAAACSDAYRALADRGHRLAIGPFATGPATGALAEINRLGVLTIAATVAGDNLAGMDDWFIRLYPSTREMGVALGAMAAADGVRSLAIIGDSANGPFVSTSIDGLRASPAAGRIAAAIAFDSRSGPPLRGVAAQAGDADAVLIIASSLDTAALAQRLRERTPSIRLYCSSWAVSAELLANGGRAIEGMRTVLPVALNDPAWQAFAGRYRERFGRPPSHVSLLHHEAAHLLAAAIAAAGSTGPEAVRRVLVGGALPPDAPGAIRLDAHGDPQRPLHRLRVVDGALVTEGR